MTLFGGADLNYRSVKSGDNKFTGMAQDGIYSSRLGFRGVEDLGGGLSANFHFEGGMNPDNGTAGGFNFARKSTIGVASKALGEVRLGRDYTPLFTVAGIADPFGTNGVGSSYNLANAIVVGTGAIGAQTAANEAGTFVTVNRGNIATTAPSAVSAAIVPPSLTYADPNAVRANNSITYYSPSFGGFNFSAMYSIGNENTNNQKAAGKMTSVKFAYAEGPLSVAFANQITKGGDAGALPTAASAALQPLGATCASGAVNPTATTQQCVAAATAGTAATDNQKWTSNFLAASYDLGVAKLSAGYKTDKLNDSVEADTAKSLIVGVAVPLGATTLKASYVTRKAEEKIGTQFAVGAVHDLSKRTSLYSTYAVLSNEAGYGMTVGSTVASNASGLKSKGFELGVKHSF